MAAGGASGFSPAGARARRLPGRGRLDLFGVVTLCRSFVLVLFPHLGPSSPLHSSLCPVGPRAAPPLVMEPLAGSRAVAPGRHPGPRAPQHQGTMLGHRGSPPCLPSPWPRGSSPALAAGLGEGLVLVLASGEPAARDRWLGAAGSGAEALAGRGCHQGSRRWGAESGGAAGVGWRLQGAQGARRSA